MKPAWIIDDDGEMAYAVSLMLKLMGYKPEIFLDPRKAMHTLLAGNPLDLMILDMNMPGVTGIDVLEFVRGRPQWQQIPIVILSVETADIIQDEAMAHGADAYLFKPMTLDEMEHAVTTAIQHRLEVLASRG